MEIVTEREYFDTILYFQGLVEMVIVCAMMGILVLIVT